MLFFVTVTFSHRFHTHPKHFKSSNLRTSVATKPNSSATYSAQPQNPPITSQSFLIRSPLPPLNRPLKQSIFWGSGLFTMMGERETMGTPQINRTRSSCKATKETMLWPSAQKTLYNTSQNLPTLACRFLTNTITCLLHPNSIVDES